jgi:hypothetical protein
MMNEAENDQSSTTSSQPSLIYQAAKLRIDDTRAFAYDQGADVILIEEHSCCNCTQPHKAGMNLVPPREHYDEEVAEIESLPSDEEDQDHHVQDGGHLSTTPDKGIQTRKMTSMASYNYPNTVYPSEDDVHRSAGQAKQILV